MIDLQTYFNDKDFIQIKNRGVDSKYLEYQIEQFINGIPSAKIIETATIKNSGIKVLSEESLKHYSKIYNHGKEERKILKFVPASGAATRMFKELYEYLSSPNTNINKINHLIENIDKFAFYSELNDILNSQNSSIKKELTDKNYKKIIDLIINESGLNYGNLPKGLIKFHKYQGEKRTAFEEHIVEGLLYATSKDETHIHFTVSPEHKDRFEILAQKIIKKYNHSKIFVNFSIQEKSTDTIAFTPENTPFRNGNNELLFRPAGHGALIYNLNNVDADLIFIKNIDNIVPDRLKKFNCEYKKAIAGIMIEIQQKIFEFINLLHNNPSVETLQEIFNFILNTLNVKIFFNLSDLSKTEKIEFLLKKLDRPIRVCSMVKNEGEPGGGPFFVMNDDNTASLQIVEKAQIDLTDNKKKEAFDSSTHFNPVDIVFSKKRFNGETFDLLKFVDKNAGFISHKSKDGKELKALELPGLWNGAMADWNTIFVEVPVEIFNPVKTIFDLLRPAHQNI